MHFDTRADWERWRRSTPCIGGSDIAQVIGRSPHKSEWELFDRLRALKDGDIPGPGEDSPRLRMGRRLEPVVLDEFADAHPDLTLDRCVLDVFQHRTYEWATCTLDALAVNAVGEVVGVVEAKTVCGHMTDAWGDAGELLVDSLDDLRPEALPVPVHIFLQAIWQMTVTGFSHAWIVALFGSDLAGVREWSIPRPEWLCDLLIDVAAEWWDLRFVQGIPPDNDASDECAGYHKRRLPKGDRTPVLVEVAGPDVDAERRAYEEAAAVAKQVEERKKTASNNLLARGFEVRIVNGQARLYQRAAVAERAAS